MTTQENRKKFGWMFILIVISLVSAIGVIAETNDCIAKGFTACTDIWGGYGKEGSFRYQVSVADCVQPGGGARFFCNTNKFYSCDPDETWTQIGMITAANNQIIG